MAGEGSRNGAGPRAAASSNAKPPAPGSTDRKAQAKQIAASVGRGVVEFGAQWFGAMQFAHIPDDDLPTLKINEKRDTPFAFNRRIARNPKGKLLPPKKIRVLRPQDVTVGQTVSVWGQHPGMKQDGEDWAQPPQQFASWGPAKADDGELARQPQWVQEAHWRLQVEYEKEKETNGIEFEDQRWPIFTIVQCTVAFALWAFCKYPDGRSGGGLDTYFPDQTDLAVHCNDCEELACVDYRAEIWRWWSYQFTHLSLWHVGTNCLLVLLLGYSLEGKQGWPKLFFMFNVGVFGGACCTFVFDVHSRVIGMSGGVYALLGMHLADTIMNFTEMELRWAIKKVSFLAFLFFVNLVQEFIAPTGASQTAHYGGAFAGLVIGVLVGVNTVVQDHEEKLRVAALIVGVVLVIFCLTWYTTQWPPKNLVDDEAWCWARQVRNRTIFRDSRPQCVRCGDEACIANWARSGALNIPC